jgi:type IX secretion system PorP/SprF family membrane protein
MRKFFTLAIVLVSVLSTNAQQDPQFSQFHLSKLYLNPGVAGSNDAICGSLMYRNQWTGFGGEPKTTMLQFDMPIESINSGAGLVVYNDELGFDRNLKVAGNFAYRLNVGAGKLGLGLSLGYMQKSIDGSKFVFNDANDNSIPTNNVSGGSFDLGLGAYYSTDKLYVGLSSAHLLEGEINLDRISTSLARHYFLMAGYSLDLTPSLGLKPAMRLESDGVSTQVDLNANLHINNKYWVGLGYRLQDAMMIMAGIEIIPNLKLGYAYDYTTSDIRTYSSGTHEVYLGYCFKPVKVVKRQFHRNVRFL